MIRFGSSMKDLILPAFAIQSIPIALTATEYSFWDRMAERWGIGLVGLVLLFFLARWTSKREAKTLAERDKREDALNKERLKALERNNELLEAQIAQQAKHSAELKQVIKDGNKYQADVGIELKNIARRVNCPPPCLTHNPAPGQ